MYVTLSYERKPPLSFCVIANSTVFDIDISRLKVNRHIRELLVILKDCEITMREVNLRLGNSTHYHSWLYNKSL